MLFKDYYSIEEILKESTEALRRSAEVNKGLKGFLSQGKSPYMLLQILAVALTKSPEYPSLTLEQLNNDPSLLLNDMNRKKMNYLMTQTRFSNDFNEIFRTIFPDSTSNPIQWSKEHREITTDLNNPQVKEVLQQVISKYNS